MMRRSRVFGTLLVLGLLAVPLGSTTLRRMSLRELTVKADAIVVARVLGNDAAWHSRMRLIWTTTRVRVEESWKGELEGEIPVMEPGGVVHPIAQRVPGMARYRPGERVVIFLHKDVLGQWRTLGCCQGKLPFLADQEGVMRLMPSAVTRHVLKDVGEGKVTTPRLDALRKQVVEIVEKEGR